MRPYSDFGLKGKFIKASIPLRNSRIFRMFYIFPRRLWHSVVYLLQRKPLALWHRRLRANYEQYWEADSDALNDIDSFDVWLWFLSRGDECLNYPNVKDLIRPQQNLVIRINK